MKNFFKFIRSDKIIYFGFIASTCIMLFSIFGLLLFFQFLPPFLPIYNKLPWGYARIGNKLEIFIPIGIAFLAYAVNSLICKFVYGKVLLLGRILSAVTFLISLLLFIYIAQIIFLVH